MAPTITVGIAGHVGGVDIVNLISKPGVEEIWALQVIPTKRKN